MSTTRETVKDIFLATGIASTLDWIWKRVGEKTWDKAADKVVGYVEQRIKDEHRVELFSFLELDLRTGSAAEKRAAERLLLLQQMKNRKAEKPYKKGECYKAGDEDHFIHILTKLYVTLDAPEHHDARRELFKKLGNEDFEVIDNKIEFLNHDVAMQWFSRTLEWIQTESLKLNQKVNEFLAPKNKALRDWIEKERARTGRKGIF